MRHKLAYVVILKESKTEAEKEEVNVMCKVRNDIYYTLQGEVVTPVRVLDTCEIPEGKTPEEVATFWEPKGYVGQAPSEKKEKKDEKDRDEIR